MESKLHILQRLISENTAIPNITLFENRSFQPGYKFDYHSYSKEIEIVYVLYGSSYVVIDEQYIKIKKNECLIIYPNVRHNFFLKYNESCRILDLVFDPGRVAGLFNDDELKQYLKFLYECKERNLNYIRFPDCTDMKNLLERMYLQFNGHDEYSDVMLHLYFCELYFQISKIINDSFDLINKPRNKHVASAMEFIANFYNTRMTLDDIAKYAGISSRHIVRLFSRELGMSIQDYIDILKVRKAKELLENTNMSVTSIAYNLGYGSSQYFTTFFKKFQNVTPKEYRHNVRN